MSDPNEQKLARDLAPKDSTLNISVFKRSFFQHEWARAKSEFTKFLIKQKEPSVLLAEVSLLHTARLFWINFCKTLFSIMAVVKTTDGSSIKNTLEEANFIFEFLSVAIFVFRFLVNLVDALSQSKNKKQLVAAWSSLGLFMIRDLAWATANLFSSYGKYFGFDLKDVMVTLFDLTIPVTGIINVAALLFETAIFMIQWLGIDRVKHNKLCKELPKDSVALLELQENWQQKKIKNLCILFILSITIVGVTASLIFSGGLALPICNAVVFLAVSLSRTIVPFLHYKKTKETFQNNMTDNNKDKYEQSRNAFGVNMIKKVMIPTIFILVCAASWQAAITCIAAYMLFQTSVKAYHHFFKPQTPKSSLLEPSANMHKELSSNAIVKTVEIDPYLFEVPTIEAPSIS
jgi:hypothetical protein